MSPYLSLPVRTADPQQPQSTTHAASRVIFHTSVMHSCIPAVVVRDAIVFVFVVVVLAPIASQSYLSGLFIVKRDEVRGAHSSREALKLLSSDIDDAAVVQASVSLTNFSITQVADIEVDATVMRQVRRCRPCGSVSKARTCA
jgi:hypothetical protein